MSNQSTLPDVQKNEVGLIDLLIILKKHKRLVILLPVVTALIAGGISFALPEAFKATTKLLPPQQAQSSAAALLSQLGGVASLTGIKTPNDVYVGMLKSRVLADHLIEKFELKKVYGTESQEKARQTLEENTSVDINKEGLITVSVEHPDRKNVAPLTNAYVEELMRMTKSLAVGDAARRRLFFEQQLETSKDKLAKAEVALKGALDRNGVVSVDSDSRAIIETIGRLRAQISAKEVALRSMSAFVTPGNPDYQRTQEELKSLKGELSRLENGHSESDNAADGQGKSGLENVKILRDVKYYQMLYELLAKQYEAARLDEARDPAVIQVLDPAVEPEKKVKPKRVIIVLLSLVFSFFIAVFWIFLKEMIGDASPENRKKLALLGIQQK